MFKRLVTFLIPLPRALAIPTGQAFYARLDDRMEWLNQIEWPQGLKNLEALNDGTNFVAIQLSHVQKDPTLDATSFSHACVIASMLTGLNFKDLVEAVDVDLNELWSGTEFVSGTVVTATTVIEAEDEEDENGLVARAFDRCLGEIRRLEQAYLAVSGDLSYRVISRQRLFPLSLTCFYNPFVAVWENPGAFQTNLGNSLNSPFPMLDSEQMERVKSQWVRIRQHDPFTMFVSRSIDAERFLHRDGDFSEAVVSAYTSVEILLDTVWTAMAWEEIHFSDSPDLEFNTVVGWFSNRSTLDVRLTNCFRGRLLGWDTENKGNPAYWWRYGVAPLRHRIIHAGHVPTEEEAAYALMVCRDLDSYMKDLLSADNNRGRYPRTALMWLGVPGLERRGKYIGKIKRLAETNEEDNWVDGLVAFRYQLDQALGRNSPNSSIPKD